MSYEANARAALQALGLDPKNHLPIDGTPSAIYVIERGKHAGTSLVTFVLAKSQVKPRGHRLMAECPRCGNTYTVGCIEQHLDAHRQPKA
jgi:hypothetical protein